MRRNRFRLITLAWITAVVSGLMFSPVPPAPVALADPGEWDPTLPAQISAGAPGDPLAVANASLQATAQATQTTLDLGKQFLGGLGINLGGNAAGPSKGIDSGANITGFDCSGLVLYSFAGVGIKLPHYSGSQYNMGRKIPSSQMRRGDVIFYGPGGSQHVTIYLGDGQMLEAPDIGLKVRVAPVRTSGMTPYVVRYIEW